MWYRRLIDACPFWLYRLVLRFEGTIELRVSRFAKEVDGGGRVLDAGAGECRHAAAFPHCTYLSVDSTVGDFSWNYGRLSAVADLCKLPFTDDSFEAALNIVVLEHTRNPSRVVAELARVLTPGGQLLLIAPLEWPEHQVPHDYFRYTRYGLAHLLIGAGFLDLHIEPVGGFFTLLGRRLLDAALYFQGGWRWLLFPPVALIAGPLGLLLPLLDPLDRQRQSTLGFVCRARAGGR